ncbi:MAG: DinB family protein [Candidatus Eisenbacteria bacterium]|nr:DinB family protein [Candidatus Eisenbacteria bacterium]
MTIKEMFEHAESSRRRILAVAEKMDGASFVARKPGLPSVRDLLVHMMDAEDYWMGSVVLGEKHRKYTPEKYSAVEALEADWNGIRERTRRFLSAASAETLRETRAVPGDAGGVIEVETILWHFLTHEIHHRGQVCILMRENGVVPPVVDLL